MWKISYGAFFMVFCFISMDLFFSPQVKETKKILEDIFYKKKVDLFYGMAKEALPRDLFYGFLFYFNGFIFLTAGADIYYGYESTATNTM